LITALQFWTQSNDLREQIRDGLGYFTELKVAGGHPLNQGIPQRCSARRLGGGSSISESTPLIF
jgi:hypothetical protein